MNDENQETKPKVIDKRMTVPEEKPVYDIAMVLNNAVNRGAPLETIEKLMELQERYEKNAARKEYYEAMAKFKADPPRIIKEKRASFETKSGGTASYSYPELAKAAEAINRSLGEHGLHASWRTEQNNGSVTVTCTISHRAGHSESTSLTASPDTTGTKNTIQALGSTISYLERYTLLALTGLAAEGMDDDGHSASGPKPITEAQVTILNDLIDEKYKTDELKAKFLEWVQKNHGADSIETLPASKFKVVKVALENVKSKKG